VSVTITTDVFCDRCGNWAHFRAASRAYPQAALQAASAAGWTVMEDGRCMCPKCNGTDSHYWGRGSETGTPTLQPVRRGKAKPPLRYVAIELTGIA
jgi:hypothetical protein